MFIVKGQACLCDVGALLIRLYNVGLGEYKVTQLLESSQSPQPSFAAEQENI